MVVLAMPDSPASRRFQVASRSSPIGVTQPIPVITTLRMSDLFIGEMVGDGALCPADPEADQCEPQEDKLRVVIALYPRGKIARGVGPIPTEPKGAEAKCDQ